MGPDDLRLTREYLEEGWTTRELQRARETGEVLRLRRGVYAALDGRDVEAQHRARAAAATLLRIPGTAISHMSAAVFHRLPTRAGALERVHLTRATGAHGRREAGVHLHHTPLLAQEIESIDGQPVTALERTVADCLRREPFDWSVVLADAALARQASPASLRVYAAAGERRPGNRNLRRVLDFADARSESPAESLSRVAMWRARIPVPRLQFEVITRDGEWVATSDFAWPEFGLIGEVDGRIKYDQPDRGRLASAVVAQEKQREELIRACGWSITRWGWDVAVDHHRLGTQLRQALQAAPGPITRVA